MDQLSFFGGAVEARLPTFAITQAVEAVAVGCELDDLRRFSEFIFSDWVHRREEITVPGDRQGPGNRRSCERLVGFPKDRFFFEFRADELCRAGFGLKLPRRRLPDKRHVEVAVGSGCQGAELIAARKSDGIFERAIRIERLDSFSFTHIHVIAPRRGRETRRVIFGCELAARGAGGSRPTFVAFCDKSRGADVPGMIGTSVDPGAKHQEEFSFETELLNPMVD